MTRDAYPLTPVEGIRERAEASATEALATALNALAERGRERAEALHALGAHRRRVQEAPDESRTTAAAWAREQAYRDRQREHEHALEAALELAAVRESRAREVVREARKALGHAAKERAVVSAHRERWQAGVNRERNRREEDEQEEWASR